MTPLLTSITSIIGSITAIVLAFYISSQGLKNKVRFSYFLASLTAGLWLLIYTLWLWQTDYDQALILIRFVMFFAIFTYPTLLHFVLRFLNYKNDFVIYIAYFSAIFLSYFCLFTDKFVSGVTQKLLYPFWGVRGGLIFDLYVLIWIFVIIFSLYLMMKKYREENDSFKKAQIRFVLLGLTFGYIGGATNFFLWYDIPIPPYGNILIPIYFSLIAYAIVKYRFADIRLIIRRSAIFAFLVLIITSVYALIAYLISVFFQDLIGTQSVILNGIITAVFVAIGFEPLKDWLSQVTDKYFFKATYKPEEVLAEFSERFSALLDIDVLSQFIVTKLDEVFKLKKASLFLFDKDEDVYYRVAQINDEKGQEEIDKSLFKNIYDYLKEIHKEKDILVRDEIVRYNESLHSDVLRILIKELEKNDVNMIVPIYLQDKLTGILFLGDKKSGDVFTTEDIQMMEILAGQASVALQNAHLYEEQKNFAQHLETVVAERTKALQDANIQLKKLDKAKSEFISIASHQLRTPLTVIKGYISMVSQGDYGKISDQVSEPLDRIYKSTLRIINLVEDLLNISRIESGRMKYDFSKADLAKIVNSVYEELEQHAKNKGLEFKYIKPKKELPEIIMDQKKIREVVMNLMDNAIKYTDQGSITITLEKKNNSIVYCVKDTGRGVEPDEMPMLFKKFSRAKGAKLVHTEGTGLGLYIAKQIIERHGGKIWAESQGRNKGSKFCIEFKIKNKKLEKELDKQKKSSQKSKQKNNKK
ncbi:MAG: GAF domain-containing protein [Candidatus Buchananbacteria bacterium]|nr:GAF domain-containing protein [Candidatus Buchananbacteria bacterium]